MSFRTDDDAHYWLERFAIKAESRRVHYAICPEGRQHTLETIRLTRKTGEFVTGDVTTSDFSESRPRARCMHGLSLVMFAAVSWPDFKHNARGEGIPLATLRREWYAWHRLAKPFRAFLTAEELMAL